MRHNFDSDKNISRDFYPFLMHQSKIFSGPPEFNLSINPMKTTKNVLLTFSIALMLAACSSNSEKGYEGGNKDEIPVPESGAPENSMTEAHSPKAENYHADSIVTADSRGSISSIAAIENPNDTGHKFIRTADIKFRVKNVVEATYSIEDITRHFDGFVTYTRLGSTIDNTTLVPISADSSLESTYFTVRNEMTLRVPNTQLDTTLKSIAKLVDFMDYRIIHANDISLELLSQELTQKRISRNEKRLMNAIDEQGRKLNETVGAEENLLNKQEQSDRAKIAKLSLMDQVKYSTVKLEIYQRQEVTLEKVSHDKNINEYKPGLGSRIGESFKKGWVVVESFIVAMTEIWWLLILTVAGIILLRKFGSTKSK